MTDGTSMTLTDGVIVLHPLDVSDVAAHLAGEDEELVRWLNGGPGTQLTVEAHIRACMAAWRAGGPTFNFGIRAGVPERLIGTVDTHLELPLPRGQRTWPRLARCDPPVHLLGQRGRRPRGHHPHRPGQHRVSRRRSQDWLPAAASRGSREPRLVRSRPRPATQAVGRLPSPDARGRPPRHRADHPR